MSDRARRIDRASGDTSKAKKLPNGWLRVDGNLTTVGVFPYRKPDGSIRRELRLPEEVFHKDALESFSLVPVTDDHPPEFLDATNTREYSRGTVGEEPRRDGDFVRSTLFVTDEELVARIETKDKRELSCGYTCDLDETPGTHPQYGAYDVIQRKIRGNHVALVKRGRAGREAAVRMDAAESVVIRNEDGPGTDTPPGSVHHNQEPPVKHTIRIDGIDVEVTTEQGAQMLARHQAKQTADMAELQKKLDEANAEKTKLTAKLDTALEEVKKKDAELKELPGKLKAEGKARADLEHDARRVLGQKVKLDKLDDTAVRLLALEKLDVKLGEAKQKDAAYVTARFDSELERLDEEGDEPAVSKARRHLEPVGREDEGDDENVDDDGDGEDDDAGDEPEEREERRDTRHLKGSERADASRDRMVKDAGQAWKKTLKRLGVEAS